MRVPETGEKQEHFYSEVLALSSFFCLFVMEKYPISFTAYLATLGRWA